MVSPRLWRLLACCVALVAWPKRACAKKCGSKKGSRRRDSESVVTFAVTTRAYAAELPYLTSWLEHYSTLDFAQVCIMVTRPQDTEPIKALLQPFNTSGRIVLLDGRDDLHAAMRKATGSERKGKGRTPCYKHTWHLGADPDEFFVLPPFMGLHDFVAQDPNANEYRLEWLNVPDAGSDSVIQPPLRTYTTTGKKKEVYSYDGLGVQKEVGRGKYLAKLSEVDNWYAHAGDCHHEKDRKCCHGPPGVMLHFNRGLADAVLKERTALKVDEFAKSGARLKFLALSEVCLSIEALSFPVPQWARRFQLSVDKKLEARLLSELGISAEGGSCEKYLDCKSLSSIQAWYTGFKQALLAHHKEVICDLHHYCLFFPPPHQAQELHPYDTADFLAWGGRKCLGPRGRLV